MGRGGRSPCRPRRGPPRPPPQRDRLGGGRGDPGARRGL